MPAVNDIAPFTPSAWLRFDTVRRMLPPGVKDVLEVGCGQGSFGVRLAQWYDYLGLEPDPASFAVARYRLAQLGRGEVRNLRVADLEDRSFDLVAACEVIEHIEDDVAALAEWTARLRPGGWILLSVPAYQRRFGAADTLAGHFRRYDPPQMHDLLANAGYTDITIRMYAAPIGYALEAARNAIGRRRLATSAKSATVAERTAASGRLMQPKSPAYAFATRWGTAPFRVLQRAFPNTGPALVVRARLS